jgi:hypothetical protein
MLGKISGLSGAVGVLLAVIAGFVAIPNLDVGLVLVVLGLLGGITAGTEGIVPRVVAAIGYPVIGAALAHLPMVGDKLNAVTGNLALGVSGAAASAIAIFLYGKVKGELMGLAK